MKLAVIALAEVSATTARVSAHASMATTARSASIRPSSVKYFSLLPTFLLAHAVMRSKEMVL